MYIKGSFEFRLEPGSLRDFIPEVTSVNKRYSFNPGDCKLLYEALYR